MPRYCGLSIFLPNSETLAETVQTDILSLLIEFPTNQVIRVEVVAGGRGGAGDVRYPGLGNKAFFAVVYRYNQCVVC